MQVFPLGPSGGPHASALLIASGSDRMLIDCGPDTLSALKDVPLVLHEIDCVLFTGLRAGQMSDFGPLLLACWRSGRREPLTVYGPAGTEDLVEATRTLYAADIQHGLTIERLDSNGVRVDVHEIAPPQVLATPALTVTAILDQPRHSAVYRLAENSHSLFVGSSAALMDAAQEALGDVTERIVLGGES